MVHYEISGGVAVITIDNPPVNALGPDVWVDIDMNVARAVARQRAGAATAGVPVRTATV